VKLQEKPGMFHAWVEEVCTNDIGGKARKKETTRKT
jgi:hypothetical protein